jgi:hypothetical protein
MKKIIKRVMSHFSLDSMSEESWSKTVASYIWTFDEVARRFWQLPPDFMRKKKKKGKDKRDGP